MRVPKVLLGLVALATLATGTVVVGTPVHAQEKPTVIEIDDRGEGIAVQAVRDAVERSTGEWLDGPDRAVVVTDDGADLTPEQVEALLGGKDAGEVEVLKAIDRVPVDTTVNDLTEGVDTAARVIIIFDDVIVIVGCTPRGCIVIVIWW
jgi:hypothetical protein